MLIPVGDDVKGKIFPFTTYCLILLNLFVFFKFGVQERFLLVPSNFSNFSFDTFISIFSSMFIHASILHLLGNMFYLFIFGKSLESKIGSWRFLFLYLLGGVFSALFYVAFKINSSIPVLGASGAISAIMGGYLLFFFKRNIIILFPFPPFKFKIKAYIFFFIWLIFQFLTMRSKSIAVPAHIGGWIFGFVTAKAFEVEKRGK